MIENNIGHPLQSHHWDELSKKSIPSITATAYLSLALA